MDSVPQTQERTEEHEPPLFGQLHAQDHSLDSRFREAIRPFGRWLLSLCRGLPEAQRALREATGRKRKDPTLWTNLLMAQVAAGQLRAAQQTRHAVRKLLSTTASPGAHRGLRYAEVAYLLSQGRLPVDHTADQNILDLIVTTLNIAHMAYSAGATEEVLRVLADFLLTLEEGGSAAPIGELVMHRAQLGLLCQAVQLGRQLHPWECHGDMGRLRIKLRKAPRMVHITQEQSRGPLYEWPPLSPLLGQVLPLGRVVPADVPPAFRAAALIEEHSDAEPAQRMYHLLLLAQAHLREASYDEAQEMLGTRNLLEVQYVGRAARMLRLFMARLPEPKAGQGDGGDSAEEPTS